MPILLVPVPQPEKDGGPPAFLPHQLGDGTGILDLLLPVTLAHRIHVQQVEILTFLKILMVKF